MWGFLDKHFVDGVLIGAISGLAIWLAANMLGKPILALRDARLKTIQTAERYAYFNGSASSERVSSVRREIFDIASELLAQARSHSWIVRLYCRFLRYDLEEAALALRGIGEMAGEVGYAEQSRTNNLNHVYISLRAHHHLPPEVVRRHHEMVGKAGGEGQSTG